MDTRTLEIILTDQISELDAKRKQQFCYRKEEDLIDLNSPQAQVVIGVRRSGKSTLCFKALHKAGVKFAYVNFDDERLVDLKASDLNEVLSVLYKINGQFEHLFIDEIQNIPEWYLFVNRLLRTGIHVVITGSNANLLSGELATHLTGRHHAITLYPFSFAEYCELKAIDSRKMTTEAIANRRAAFDEYMVQGGFPELQFIRSRKAYIDGLVNNILKRDIEKRFRIKHTATFEKLAHHLMNNVPTIVAYKNLQETFNLKSDHTVKNYVSYLKEAYVFEMLQKFSYKSSQRITNEKAYAIDVTLMNERENAFAGENLGWRLETIIYIELLRRYKNDGYDICYLNERSGECDFLICRGRQVIQAIQVSYDLTSPKVKKREIAGLLLAARKTHVTDLLLITDHLYEDLEIDGYKIRIRPAYEYLLDK